MAVSTEAKRQSSVTFPWSQQLVSNRGKMPIPTLRRSSHSGGNPLADAILVPASGDVNTNLGALADDLCDVALDVTTAAGGFSAGAALFAEPTAAGTARVASSLDDEDEDDDSDEDEDDRYDDDELDEDDDEDLDDEDDEGYDDDLEDDDSDLDDNFDDDEDEDDEDDEDE